MERSLSGFNICRGNASAATPSTSRIHCPHCGDDGGFRFPVFHAAGIAVLIAGAVLYHYYPEFGAAILRLSGNGALLPD